MLIGIQLSHHNTLKLILSAALCLACLATAQAADYEHGNQAMQLFDAEGMENSPRWVMAWIMFMMVTFLSGLLFVWKHPIARWVIGGMFAGMAFGMVAQSAFNIPPFSGFIALIHIIFWSPGLYQLLTKRPFMGPRSAFSIWSGVMTAVILFSFIFDIRDATIYLSHVL